MVTFRWGGMLPVVEPVSRANEIAWAMKKGMVKIVKTQSRRARLLTAAMVTAVTVAMSLFGGLSSASAQPVSSAKTSSTIRIPGVGGTYQCGVFFFGFELQNGSRQYVGHGGGLGSVGGAVFVGDIYTNDAERLYRETVSFQVNAASPYVNINFFNRNAENLGSLHAGGVGVCAFLGGGSGRWTR